MSRVIEFPQVKPEAGAQACLRRQARPYKSEAAPSAEDPEIVAAEECLREQTAREMDLKAFTRFWRCVLVGLMFFWTGVGWLILRALR